MTKLNNISLLEEQIKLDYPNLKFICNAISITEDMKETLDRYILNKIPPGSFTLSILENDLIGALEKADEYNKYHLYELVSYIVNNLPPNSYGSIENVKNWLKKD